jgi:hypothetical protein
MWQANQATYKLHLHSGRAYEITLTEPKCHSEADLATLTFSSNQEYQIAQLREINLDTNSVGMEIFAVGFPDLNGYNQVPSYRFSQGMISGIDSNARQDYEIIHETTNSRPGMSGGPLLDKEGYVIGVNGLGIQDINLLRIVEFAGVPIQSYFSWQQQATTVIATSLPPSENEENISPLPSSFRVFCDESGPEPLTVVSNGEQTAALILWRDRTDSDSGWPPIKRCIHVSNRFNNLYTTLGSDFLIYYGYINNQPVLCATQYLQGRYQCRENGLILTLKHDEDREKIYQDLIAAMRGSGDHPVSMDAGDHPVSMDEWIDFSTSKPVVR